MEPTMRQSLKTRAVVEDMVQVLIQRKAHDAASQDYVKLVDVAAAVAFLLRDSDAPLSAPKVKSKIRSELNARANDGHLIRFDDSSCEFNALGIIVSMFMPVELNEVDVNLIRGRVPVCLFW